MWGNEFFFGHLFSAHSNFISKSHCVTQMVSLISHGRHHEKDESVSEIRCLKDAGHLTISVTAIARNNHLDDLSRAVF